MPSTPQTIKCFCGSIESSPVKMIPYRDERFVKRFQKATILKCSQCGLMRTSPTPILDMPEIYEEDSVSSSHEQNTDLWKKFSQEVIEKIKMHKSSGKLLDVGCNIGVLVHEAQLAGFDAEGIDLNQAAVDYGRTHFNIPLKKERLENISGSDRYDVIVMNHVIEHIPDLQTFGNHIRRLLKPDGLFLAVCPNAESGVAQVLNILNKRKSGKGSNWFWYGYLPEQHVWQFGPHSLKRVMEECHFKTLKVSANQNMHWGVTESKQLRFRLMKALWSLFAFLGKGDNLFIWCSPNKSISNTSTQNT